VTSLGAQADILSIRFYNKTRHSGLETHISNSYTNSLLQAYHYTLPFRACAKAHIAIDCPKEHCMLCEAGFLFRMLEDAKGINCQASNFSRAFGATSQGTSVGPRLIRESLMVVTCSPCFGSFCDGERKQEERLRSLDSEIQSMVDQHGRSGRCLCRNQISSCS
jgi:hypothetical protein